LIFVKGSILIFSEFLIPKGDLILVVSLFSKIVYHVFFSIIAWFIFSYFDAVS